MNQFICHDIVWDTARAEWVCRNAHSTILLGLMIVAVLVLIGVLFMSRHHHEEHEELEVLRDIDKEVHEIAHFLKPRPTSIKIRFNKKGETMPLGPVTLIVGQKTTASVVVFDQNGADMTSSYDFNANPITWAIDNSALDSQSATGPDSSNSDLLTSLAAGTANLTATTGKLTDTEQVINQAAAPVPTSVKISFTTPQ